ncbi:MAG TPA: DUF6491 family protein [Steroidobacteraceae bacterium]|nr:DUF6491 family protein [Steroidobacteraceae bacterium]
MIPDASAAAVPASRAVHTVRTAATLLVIAALLLALAPRARAATAACERQAVRSDAVLLAPSMADWEPLGDRAVVIWTKHSLRASLVRLARPLPGLTSAAVITLIDGDGDRLISPCGDDSLTLGDGKAGTARIASIRRLSARQTAALDRGGPIQVPALSST